MTDRALTQELFVAVSSTTSNADLVASAGGRGDREVLVAERQTSGRGRLDRE